jgi:threonine synthase
LCSCGAPLLARYNITKLAKAKKESLSKRVPSLWRYREFLPIINDENIVTLGEGMTPIVPLKNIGSRLGIVNLWLKDEGILPTGTFKCRGATVGVSKARELGVKTLIMPTNGNAGAAWAMYCARAGINAHIVMPEDAPSITRSECCISGAKLYLVRGLIGDAGRMVARAVENHDWYDTSTLKEPYRIEGKKTMALEILEQLNWEVPDVIVYPTGGGVGIIGIYKSLRELQEIGWIQKKMPRLVSVQSTGCAPIVKAWQERKTESEAWLHANTIAFGINVAKALGDFLVLDAIYKTDGCAVAVTDDAILTAQAELAEYEGALVCPEGAATLAATINLLEHGWLSPNEKVVLLNTGTGLIYPETINIKAVTLSPEENLPV